MWLPILLDELNITDMHANGFKLSADDIYSVNHSSMKDAVCQFGGGCTAELISSKGLLLTNHHCGFGYLQSHSSNENNYLDNGFWAMNQQQELACPGLTVTFIVSMEDVTDKILVGVSDTMSEASRNKIIDVNSKALAKENTKQGFDAFVRPFFYGNVFYLFVTQTFKDVRMVGAPPQEIGNFGGDSDNWMWPRQTADFSLFRIYADKNNDPADYSKENIPYTPKKFFRINANGVGENDFTMVYGFPGRTTEYLTSYGVGLLENVADPVKVDMRTTRITIMEDEMKKDPEVKMKYAAKRNGAANAWKKWQGEEKGLKETNTIALKQAREDDFSKKINADAALKNKYGDLLPSLQKANEGIVPYEKGVDYMSEGIFSVELVGFANQFSDVIKYSSADTLDVKKLNNALNAVYGYALDFYKNYSVKVDKEEAFALITKMMDGIDSLYPYDPQLDIPSKIFYEKNGFALPFFCSTVQKKYKGDLQKYLDMIWSKSILLDSAKLFSMLRKWKPSDWKKISMDPAFVLTGTSYLYYDVFALHPYMKFNAIINALQRRYMKAMEEVFPEKKFYPDANFTLRVAYGKIDDYSPRDGVQYSWYSTLDGVMEKEDNSSFDYKVPARLHELWEKKDYGPYADKKDGKLHTSFIATNHTTGGNSGSPVLDANGDLIGTNFDRCWEGTMSDVNYDPKLCRNIVLDVRYTLFIIDKYAGAGYLMNEMEFVK